MKISAAIFLLLITSSPLVIGQAKIKGHYIGESITDFRASEGIDAKLAACRTSDAKTVSPYHISQMSESEFRAFQQTLVARGYGNLSRKKAEKLAASGEFNTKESRSSDQEVECKALFSTFENGVPQKYTKYVPSYVSFDFEGGKISEIYLQLPRPSFDETEADLVKRLGIVPEISIPEMFNASGARWKDRQAIWLDSSIYAVLRESNNPAEPAVSLIVESRALFDAAVKRRVTAPSPLD